MIRKIKTINKKKITVATRNQANGGEEERLNLKTRVLPENEDKRWRQEKQDKRVLKKSTGG